MIEAAEIDDEGLTELLRELVRRPFDLRAPPLLRATLIRIAPEDHALLTSANHIVWDGWSKGIFFSELAELYEAFTTRPGPGPAQMPIQYGGFRNLAAELVQGELMEVSSPTGRGQLRGRRRCWSCPRT